MSAASIRLQRKLEWIDTDASGHWHNTAAIRLVEWAEAALLERLGLLGNLYGHMPRVRIEAEFRKPLHFNELAEVQLEVVAVGGSSITFDCRIARDGERCADIRFVAVLRGADGRAARWPDDVRERLLTAGPQQ